MKSEGKDLLVKRVKSQEEVILKVPFVCSFYFVFQLYFRGYVEFQ